MKLDELKNTDPEDIEDVIRKIESSFSISFAMGELSHITTFGELCDYITNKIVLDQFDDCTTQQAFYKLRSAISEALTIERSSITTDYPLIKLLPRKSRRARIKNLEKHLGFKLDLLRPPHWLTWSLLILMLASFPLIFIDKLAAIAGFVFSIAALWIASKTGIELKVKTVGQLAEKITRENYLKSRRNPDTFNKGEVEKILVDLFSNELILDKNKLTRESTIV